MQENIILNNFINSVALLVCGLGVLQLKNIKLVLLNLLVLYSSYSLYDAINGKKLSIYADIGQNEYLHIVSLNVLVSLIVINLSSYLFKEKKIITLSKSKPDIFYYLILILSTYLITTSLQGESVLESLSYGSNKNKSSLYEYLIVPIVYLFFRYKVNKFYWYLILYYSLKTFLFGGRIEVLELFLGIAFIYTDGFQKYTLRQLVVSIIFFFVLLILGYLRENITSIVLGTVDSNKNYDYVIGFSPDILYSSMRILHMIDIYNIDFLEKVEALFKIILSPIYFDSAENSLQQLPLFMKNSYESGGGGLFFTFIYSVGGYYALVPIVATIAIILNISSRSKFNFILSLFVVVSMPRWLLYNPIVLFRFVFFGIVIHLFFELLKLSSTKKCEMVQS